MGLGERYETEEQAIIDDETLTKKEKDKLLSDLYWEAKELDVDYR